MTFTEIRVEQSYTGSIGVAQTGVTAAVYLQHASPLVNVGQTQGDGSPTGSPLLMFNSNAVTCTYNVRDSASSATDDATLPPVRIKGSAVTLNQTGGNVGVAVYGGETATLAAAKLTKGDGEIEPEPSLFLGPGVTVTAMTVLAGEVLSRSNLTCTAVSVFGGSYEITGTGGHTTASVYGEGTVYYSGTGTIQTLNVGGTFDRTRDTRNLTITDLVLFKGFNLQLNNGALNSTIVTNTITASGCSNQDGTIVAVTGEIHPHV